MQKNSLYEEHSSNKFFASKEECHLKTEKVYDDWDQALKLISKNAHVHEDFQKTAKMFTQIDSMSKNTINTLEKTSKMLDELLDRKLAILATAKDFDEISSALELSVIVKNNWNITTLEETMNSV